MTDETTSPGVPTPDGESDIIETEYDIGQDNIEGRVGPFGFDIHNPVFLISGLSVLAFVVYALLVPTQASAIFSGADLATLDIAAADRTPEQARMAEIAEGCEAGAFCDIGLRNFLTSNFDWFFLLSANAFVLFCLALIVLPVGSVRLGGVDAKPDYGYPAGSRCCSPPAWASG